MNNEPVAWMIRRDENITKGIGHEIQLTLMDATRPEFWIKGKIAKGYEVFPLYTHPAKTPMLVLDGNRVYPTAKTLTDEEIKEVIRKHWNKELGNRGMLALCKAILKKASVK